MITLDSTTKKLQVLMDATATTTESPIQVAFDEINSRFLSTQKDADGITTGVTPVDIIAAPSAGFRRRLTGLSVFNADTVARTVTVRLNNNGTARKVVSVTLQTGEALYYSQHTGFYCVDVNGNQKSNAPASSGAASTADSKALSVSLLASTADSKAVSDGVVISTNLSTFTTASGVTSSTESLRTSAGNSTTLSKTKSSFSF